MAGGGRHQRRAPQWAGLIAIANQGRALSGLGTLDGVSQTLPIIYSLYSAPGTSGYSSYTSDFNDIIDPRNFFEAATPGYDQLTGVGSPKAFNVVDALADISPGSQPITPTPPTTPVLPPSTIEATIISSLPVSAVGDTIGSMTLRLFNTGATAFSGPLSVALYTTTDGSITASDTPFETVTLDQVNVAANKASKVVVHFKYPTNVPNGSYQFAAAVTATGAGTAPADAVASDSVSIAAPIVDLDAKALQKSTAVNPGHRKSIEIRITNTGNFTASGVLTLNLYSSTDTTLDASDPMILSFGRRIALRPARSMLVNLRFVAPSSLAAGSYNLIAAASSSIRPPDVDSGDKIVVIATRG